MSLYQVIELLAEEKNIHIFRDIPKVFLYGTFAKKALVNVPYYNSYTGEKGEVIRSRLENRVFDWKGSEESKVEMTISKHWQSHHPESVENLDFALPVDKLEMDQKQKSTLVNDLITETDLEINVRGD